jgi:hypothetical protein
MAFVEEVQFGSDYQTWKKYTYKSYKNAHNFWVDQGTTKYGTIPQGSVVRRYSSWALMINIRRNK